MKPKPFNIRNSNGRNGLHVRTHFHRKRLGHDNSACGDCRGYVFCFQTENQIFYNRPPVFNLYAKHMDPERWSRIISFADPEKFAKTSGYQLWNSLLALGSGFWSGLGFTQSRLKWNYLSEAHTDFILSIAGEELGFMTILPVIPPYRHKFRK